MAVARSAGHPDYAPLSCHAPERPARRDAALREDSAGAHAHHMFVRSPLDIQLDNTCAGSRRAAEGRGLRVLRREGGRPARRRRWMCTSTKSISFSRLIRPRSRSVERRANDSAQSTGNTRERRRGGILLGGLEAAIPPRNNSTLSFCGCYLCSPPLSLLLATRWRQLPWQREERGAF